MKIKVYIVTYKKNEILNTNLKSLWYSTIEPQNLEVTILANHPDVEIYEENKRSNLRVVINTTRMPHAWGYLSRDWNYCILDCFKTWQNPENIDWLVMAQNDVTWVKGWDEWLKNNKDYDFVSQPRGDQAMAMNINCVRKVGFFDERFTTIACQEADYFRRAKFVLINRASINDDHTIKSMNDGQNNKITNTVYSGDNEDITLHTTVWTQEFVSYLFGKWKVNRFKFPDFLDKALKINNLPEEINWYPFFWQGYDKSFLYWDKKYFLYNNYYQDLKKVKYIKLRRILSCFIPSKSLRKKIRDGK